MHTLITSLKNDVPVHTTFKKRVEIQPSFRFSVAAGFSEPNLGSENPAATESFGEF